MATYRPFRKDELTDLLDLAWTISMHAHTLDVDARTHQLCLNVRNAMSRMAAHLYGCPIYSLDELGRLSVH